MSRSKRSIKDRSGFLLLEVLVSVTVITVGLVYVIRSFSSSTRAIETATCYLKSLSLAEEKMWELEAKRVVSRGKSDGSFKEDSGYKWQIEAAELDDIPVNVVQLLVEWQGVERKQRVSLETYLWNEED